MAFQKFVVSFAILAALATHHVSSQALYQLPSSQNTLSGLLVPDSAAPVSSNPQSSSASAGTANPSGSSDFASSLFAAPQSNAGSAASSNLDPSQGAPFNVGAALLAASGPQGSSIGPGDHLGTVTITAQATVDVFTTLTNVLYNSVPVTLTEFIKTTVVARTSEVITTPVDDRVVVVTAPVTRTDVITVTDTSSAFQFFTEVSTDFYTVTHRVYDIQQKLITSTVVQTQVFQPTVIHTRISTTWDAETVVQTVYNTVVVQPRPVSSAAPVAVNFPVTQPSFQFSLPQAQQQQQQAQAQQQAQQQQAEQGQSAPQYYYYYGGNTQAATPLLDPSLLL